MVALRQVSRALFLCVALVSLISAESNSQEEPHPYEFKLQITGTYYVEIPPSYKSCNVEEDCVAVRDMCGIPVVINKYYESSVRKTIEEAQKSRVCGDESMARVPAPPLKTPEVTCDNLKQCVIKPDQRSCMVRMEENNECFTKCLEFTPSGYCRRNCSQGMKCYK